MRKNVLLTLVCFICLAFCLTACSGLDGTEKQDCIDAIGKLETLTEVHWTSTTLIGETQDALEVSMSSENWVSGSDWADKSSAADYALWHLAFGGESFGAMETGSQRLWQTVDAYTENMKPSWRLSGALDGYEVASVTEKDGLRVITLTADVQETTPGAYGTATYSDYSIVISLDDNGDLRKYELSYRTTGPEKDGTESTLYWKLVNEYPAFESGEIAAYLQSLYQEAG